MATPEDPKRSALFRFPGPDIQPDRAMIFATGHDCADNVTRCDEIADQETPSTSFFLRRGGLTAY